ncbi:MAG: phospholipase D family protein [Candidatus Dormibacteraceae bacterium]
MQGERLESWFLTSAERDNDATGLDRRRGDGLAWSTGNRVEPLVHGAKYFARLLEDIRGLAEGDQLYFTDWRGDPDQRLASGADTQVGLVLAEAARRGVKVKGLVWRSHLDRLGFSAKENRHLGQEVNAAGGEVLLDQRVRLGGSHHQKLVVIRHASGPEQDVAFVGGIDLCHSRRDEVEHDGDRQHQTMAPVYGPRPPWHDAQLAVQGPAVGDLEFCFRERWDDPSPLSRDPLGILHDLLRHTHRRASVLPAMPADPPRRGSHAVQVLRTYARRHGGYPFAPQGERSVARGFRKAIARARRLIYIEDQFLWSTEVANVIATALVASPSLHLVVVLPRYFDQASALTLRPNQVGREQAVRVLLDAAGDRVAIYDIENADGVPVYVHAKISVVDDVWASVGSDNFNRRSWSHDSEISCAVIDEERDGRKPLDPAGLGDGARRFARDMRLQLWREHLGRDNGDDQDLIEPVEAVTKFKETALALERWHAGGRRGARPPGHVRPHPRIQPSRTTMLWAEPAYRTIYDPDARSSAMRRRAEW